MNAMVWILTFTLGSAMAVLGWALAAWPLRIFTRATRAFVGFNGLVLLAGLSWWPWDAWVPASPAFRLALGLWVLLAGLQRLCTGLQVLHDLQPNPVATAGHLVWVAALLLGLAWLDGSGTGVWLVFFVASLWAVVVTLRQAFPSLKAQDGLDVARWSLAPLAGACVVWLEGIGDTVARMWQVWQGPAVAPLLEPDLSHLVVPPDAPLGVLVAGWGLLNCGLVGQLLLKLLDKIRELSTEDELTGALNQRSFMALLNGERDRLRRTPQPQALLVCEIDQYHGLNQQLGFAAGDAALRHVTGVLGRGLRKTDRLGRSQEAELLMFLPDTPTGGAMLVAERTQAAVKGNPFLWNGQSVALSLSIGVGVREDGDMPSETLLGFCGQAVRRAQREGGGRIRAAQYDTVVPDIPLEDPVPDRADGL
jgi:diguanylate cyclase (GGDEF)-like protein